MPAVFLYGALCHGPLLNIVLDGSERPSSTPAVLPDHVAVWDQARGVATISGQARSCVEGLLLDLGEADQDRLAFFAAAFGHAPGTAAVRTKDRTVETRYFAPTDPKSASDKAWSLDDWVRDWSAITLRAAGEVMGCFGAVPVERIARRLPLIQLRAASWLRARDQNTKADIRADLTDNDVKSKYLRRPYTNFFMVEEQDVRFREFGGEMSALVERAAFVAGDAVTLLPYDPRRDRVLVVEQFRFGPYVRGDRRPWMLEPIAGRIDAGESPEDAAVREAREESGLSFERLEFVARYYVSPGAVTEYLFSYVAIADLPELGDRLGGESSEEEDIRSIVMSFDELMGALASGEAETAPLILTALWLARHRDRLRAAA